MAALDLSDSVERVPALEEEAGVVISGIFASVEHGKGDHDFHLRMNFEVQSAAGTQLSKSLIFTVIAYDEKGRVVGTAEETLYSSKFSGVDVISMDDWLEHPVAKLKLFPKPK